MAAIEGFDSDFALDGHFEQGGGVSGFDVFDVDLGAFGDGEILGREVLGSDESASVELVVGASLLAPPAVNEGEDEAADEEFNDEENDESIVVFEGDGEGAGREFDGEGEVFAGGEVFGGEGIAV